MFWLDRLIAEVLAPLAVWVFINGLDDLVIDFFYVYLRLGGHHASPSPQAVEHSASAPQRKIALMIPCWQEDKVIEQMLDHNLAEIDYENYDFYGWESIRTIRRTLAKVNASEKKKSKGAARDLLKRRSHHES